MICPIGYFKGVQLDFLLYYQCAIDYTLQDIKQFYIILNTGKNEIRNEIIQKCKMHKAFLNENTYVWLNSFKNFETFINKNSKLEKFVEYNIKHSEYDVINIETGKVFDINESGNYSSEWSDAYYNNLKEILDKIEEQYIIS